MAVRKVMEAPGKVRVGTVLTDGKDHFKVDDRHIRDGEPYFHLFNMGVPELSQWFRLEDMGELFFDVDPFPQRRNYGAIRKGQ